MKYLGQFTNRNNELIEVDIITNNSEAQTQEITLGDTPVVISQTSDGIFSPIKSRSCTITIVTNDYFPDMYSSESHGTKVTVDNITKGERIFYGFLTPCEYNQPYIYLNQLELEAVDALSTLKDFKYLPISNNKINKMSDLLKYALITEAGYQNVYIPYMGNKAWEQNNYNYDIQFPTNLEYLSDVLFKESDKDEELEYKDWYTIIEEICKFFGLSAVPYGESVYLIDYKIVNYCGDKEYTEQTYSQDFKTYYNLKDYEPYYIDDNLKVLLMDDYAGSEQNIEIDGVYNKITVKADVDDVEDEDIYIDIEDDAENAALAWTYPFNLNVYEDLNNWLAKIINPNPVLKTQYTVFSRMFYPTQGGMDMHGNPITPTSDFWQCYCNTNLAFDPTNIKYYMVEKMNDQHNNWQTIHRNGNMAERIDDGEYQYCTLAQTFGWEVGTSPSAKVDWKTNIVFHTGVEPWYRYYLDINTGEHEWSGRRIRIIDKQTEYPGSNDIWSLWWNMWTNEMMCKPVLEYRGNDEVGLSPASSSDVTYICITGDLLYQKSGTLGNDTVNVWIKDTNYKVYITTTFDDAGYNAANKTESLIYTRNYGDGEYNNGWPCLKCVLNIGDKWWDGSTWQAEYREFWLYFHKENVGTTGQEKLLMYDWNKIVVNHDYTSGINEDCFAIPIYKTDNVFGKLNFKVFNPYVPLTGVTDTWVSDYMDAQLINGEYYVNINIQSCVPAVFMKDFGIKVVSVKDYINRPQTWISTTEKKNENKDITYSSNISNNNVVEFSDLDLMINTYNYKKPLAESYVFIYSGKGSYPRELGYQYLSDTEYSFKDNVNNRTNIEERLLVEQYKDHYSTPKLIYNCQVHNYYAPWLCVTPTAIGNKRMIVDEQDYDVKADINTLKLIEF